MFIKRLEKTLSRTNVYTKICPQLALQIMEYMNKKAIIILKSTYIATTTFTTIITNKTIKINVY